MTDDSLLMISLSFAVPLHIEELRRFSPAARAVMAPACAEAVASCGDVLQFKSKQKGASAEVFNALARGLAIAAYQPGGVDFAGQHWCVAPHPGCPR